MKEEKNIDFPLDKKKKKRKKRKTRARNMENDFRSE